MIKIKEFDIDVFVLEYLSQSELENILLSIINNISLKFNKVEKQRNSNASYNLIYNESILNIKIGNFHTVEIVPRINMFTLYISKSDYITNSELETIKGYINMILLNSFEKHAYNKNDLELDLS